MRDLHVYLTNPFINSGSSQAELLAFTTDHLQRMTANPLVILTPRIAPTTAALTAFSSTLSADDTKLGQRKASKQAKNDYRKDLPKNVGKIAVKVEAQYGEGSPEFNECFPFGRTIFTKCPDDMLANHLQTLINGVTAHQADLGAPVVTDATALLTGWNAVYAPSETASGNKTGTQDAKNAARTALAQELFINLQALSQYFPDQPEKLDLYMQPSLLDPHTHAPAEPTPPAPPAP
jgi:hypothetical protein